MGSSLHISSPACISAVTFDIVYCQGTIYPFVPQERSPATAVFGNRFEILGDFAVVAAKVLVLRGVEKPHSAGKAATDFLRT